jgi:formylmethanofuran dehydrogenase subunit D
MTTLTAPLPQHFTDYLIGKSEDEGQIYVLNSGYSFRVVNTDGRPHVVTRDFKATRVNVKLTNGEIVSVERG